MCTQQSSLEEKIKRFQSRFRGREDVFAKRFENRLSGKNGYAPACRNEWVRGICEKPRIKCANCPHKAFIPISEEVVRCHLMGKDEKDQPFVMGIYPMLLDETCYFLAIDLDKEGWQEDARALQNTCLKNSVPAFLERSRSGNGAHLWIFFKDAVPANLARKLGTWLLTETMEDRMFDRRCREYERLGYTILMPASAIPGWPIEVPLPVDTGWKKQYSASVLRLIRDGVDSVLAELFVNVTETNDLGKKVGVERARSRSEAFLYPRLQSLAATKDRFQLNVKLPIPLAGQSFMEVDFLDTKNKQGIEIDGPHHFQ
ncbi:MAG: TOTE conflict system archaeo-eukaryotic primase domain-containing protein, partial [Kiritimatiellia bacterium]